MGVGVQRRAPDGHEVGAVLGGRGHAEIEPTEFFTQWPELMALFRGDDDNPLPLLPQAAAEGKQREGLAGTGGPADPPVAVGVLVVVVGVEEYRRFVIHVDTQEYAVLVAELVGGKGERRGHAACQSVAAGLALDVRVQRQHGQGGQKSLLLLVVAAPGNHVHRHAQLFHRCHPLLQRLGVLRRDLDDGVHVVEILALPVHHILQVKPGSNGAVQLFVVRAGIPHIPHTGAVDHSGLGNLAEGFVFGLALDHEVEADALAGLHQRGQPAIAHGGGVAVAGDIEIGMKNAVHYNVVTAFGVHRGGRQNIQDRSGADFDLRKVRLLLAKNQPFEEGLLGQRLLALPGRRGRLLFRLVLDRPRLFLLFGNCVHWLPPVSYRPCTAVVISKTPSGSLTRRLVFLLMSSYSNSRTVLSA